MNFTRRVVSIGRGASLSTLGRRESGVAARNLLARALPVCASQTSFAAPSSLKELVQVRNFSGKSANAKPNSLAEVLAGQIHEEASNDEIDPDFVAAKQEVLKTWAIKDDAGKGVVTLSRTFKGENIVITFDCQDLAESEEDFDMSDMENEEGEEGGDEMNEDEDMEMGGESGINFDVVITKGNEKLVFNCVAYQQIQVDNVQFIPAGKEVGDKELYGGPIFQDLDEVLQESMINYLADRKIDDELSYFISSFSYNKEQKEYVNWLNSVMNFVEKK